MTAESDRPARFYKTVSAAPADGGFGVLLDGRSVRTPKRVKLTLPTIALAKLVAEEWERQGETVALAEMPATRLAFTAVDQVSGARIATIEEVVRYAASDLLCYFADAPQSLIARQEREWGPVLAWAERDLGLIFVRASGIIHQPQPQQTLDRIAEWATGANDHALSGLAFAAGLYGSAVLGLAAWRGRLTGEAAFDLSRLDEAFQEDQWGVDDEAAARTAHRRGQAVMLGAWFDALR